MGSDCSSSGGVVDQFHVLAVDDSLVDRKVIERLFKISCCKVTAVESGTMALQYLGLDGERDNVGFDELKVNLIVTDYSMPGMTGYELLKQIKGSSKLREIPVVIMSSENILARIDSCLEEGAEDFLVKPVKLSDVQRLRDIILRGADEKNEKETPRKRKVMDDIGSPKLSSTPTPSPLKCKYASPLQTSAIALPQQSVLKRPRLLQTDGAA